MKQVDFDGKFTYSDIVYVSYINESDIILYPSPAVNETNLDINLEMASKIKIQLFDATAKLIYTVADKVFDEGGHTITIHLNDLASGVYNLVLNINGEQMNKK
ncbi:MAG: T9SS type A sorting domain-containing protein [Saprospiraceae bacterium]|nr:T9SS type A sorting domain-containing protein [Saprospiraceae bacterium]